MTDHILHASAVAFGDRGVLILGASGSGKSHLALELMALGADLVSDDRTLVRPDGDRCLLAPAPNLAGLIESRGVGILRAPVAEGPIALHLMVDLDQTETDRLPPQRSYTIGACRVPLLHKAARAPFPMSIRLHVLWGRAG